MYGNEKTNAIIQEFSAKVKAQGLTEVEDILGFLRKEGCSKPNSMIVLLDCLGCGLGEAKRLTHFSQTWSDHFKPHQ
ncbi:hypothetical protein [Herpetosiphon llansteffanensis]|uniref:hypothetical protein n=1 Tax=Herpetosiphon llansteffanensis TaxID=2094568 RepID=UPI000D7C8FD9|nr:hypothetical protein [Herpetosiphon llansteffanensis]